MHRLPWMIVSGTLNTIFAQITFGGPVFLLFLADLGQSKTSIGFLLALFPFCGLLALFIGPAVARFGFRRTFITFYGLRKVVFASLLLTPLVLAQYGQQAAFLFISAVILTFAILRAVAEIGYNPWFQEFVPNAVRGRFSAVSNIAGNVAGALALVVAGAVIGMGNGPGDGPAGGLDRYMLLIAVGVVFGLISVVCAVPVPGGAPVRQRISQAAHFRGMLDALLNRDFALYLIGLAVVTLAMAPLTFVPLMMTEYAGMAESSVLLLGSATMIGNLVSSYAWGWAADRWGSRPITLLSLTLLAAAPIAWLLVPRHAGASAAVALAVSLCVGLAGMGWSLGSVRLLFNNIVPPEQKTGYLSLYYAAAGLVGGIGPLLAGAALDLLKAAGIKAFGATLDPYTPLFILSFALSLVSVLLFRLIRDDGALTTRQLAALFLRGNLFRAARSLIRYRMARHITRAESDRVLETERMGAAKSLLNADELLDALSDPSFNVRHEAIVSIARMRPDDRLFNALLEILDGNEPDLVLSAVGALGRLGDRRAIEPLRETLGSPYPLIQAHSARALATLGDTEIVPLLLERLRAESDDGLRIAYASALGTLHSRQAIDDLLAFLHATRGKGSQLELALALASIAGDGDRFAQLARQVRAGAGIPISQAVFALRRKLKPSQAQTEYLALALNRCGEAYARDDLRTGAELLGAAVGLWLAGAPAPAHFCQPILQECARGLSEYGAGRVEYELLAVHTLTVVLGT
jgi:MFS family permease